MTMKLLLVDKHELVRTGVRRLLEDMPEVDVVADVGGGREAVNEARRLRPDVVIMDVAMPNFDGIEAMALIVKECPGIRVLALSTYLEEPLVSAAFKAGACGYIHKSCSPLELINAVRTVASGEIYLSPSIAGMALRCFSRISKGESTSDLDRITRREREILGHIAQSKPNAQIARELHISAHTVETHRRRIMVKLHLRNVVDLVKFAIRNGLATAS
jgi:DNA-binding NarL/FixJ family response regulator